MNFLFMLLAALFLTFPLVNQNKRDPGMIHTIEWLKSHHIQVEDWFVINDAYPYYSLVNLCSWLSCGEVHMESTTLLSSEGEQRLIQQSRTYRHYHGIKKAIIVIKGSELHSMSELSKHFVLLAYLKKNDVMIWASKELGLQKIGVQQAILSLP